MNLHTLPKSLRRPKKRLGRGNGSGKGTHAARGLNGQKARGRMPTWFEGGQLPLIRRTPFVRGKLRLKAKDTRPISISLAALNIFSDKTQITQDILVTSLRLNQKLAAKNGVKILNSGKLEKALTVKVPLSASAAKAVTEAGGQTE